MKKSLSISAVLLFGLAAVSYSQSKSNIELSLNQTARFIGQSLRVTSSPQINRKLNSHTWYFGPAILMLDEKIASEKVFPKLIGLTFGYKYYPIKKESKINLYVYAQSSAQRIGDKWTSQIYDFETQGYIAYNYQNIEKLIFLNVGYGIELKMGNHFYVSNDVGIGTYYSSTKTNNLTVEAPSVTFPGQNINGYPTAGFSWQVGLSLAYQLGEISN